MVIEPRPKRRGPSINRLILIVVPILVILAIGWRLWLQRRQQFPLDAEKGRLEGIPALDEGNFDKAHQLLAKAKVAVDALGGAIEGAVEIRQAALEAAIFVDQTAKSLEEMLDDAGRTDPEVWASKFDTLYKGRTIVIDSWIAATPSKEGSGTYEIMYKVLPPGGASSFSEAGEARPPRIGLIDFTGFQLFEQLQPKIGAPVRFGARLATFEYDRDKDTWIIKLEPKSGVIIEHTRALESLGWPSTEHVDMPKEDQP